MRGGLGNKTIKSRLGVKGKFGSGAGSPDLEEGIAEMAKDLSLCVAPCILN